MPNLKDVFDAVTKNEQHDPDGWSDLERRQRHALRRRRTGAYVVAAVILAIAIVAAGAIVRNPDTGSPAGETPTHRLLRWAKRCTWCRSPTTGPTPSP